MVNHFFSLDRGGSPIYMVAAQLFFPGSLLSTHAAHLGAARAAGFAVTHESVHDYRPTLRAWYERLVQNRERALAAAGAGACNEYLVFFPLAWRFFDEGEARVHRMVLRKGR